MSFSIRPATVADVGVLAQLEDEARQALTTARGGPQVLAEQPPVGDWQRVLDDPRQTAWVATIDDVVVGYLQLELPGTDRVARILQVHVVPGARELGFGDDLVAEAMATAAAGGAVAIESFALPGDRETKNLFERAGITARKLIVSKRLV